MFRKLFVLIMVIAVCCGAAVAQEQEKKAGSGIAEWLKGLQLRIAQIAPKKAAPQSTIVAGVRGAKDDSAPKLYWKGKKGSELVTEEELAEFKEGVELAAKGDKALAVHELEEFMKIYPDSALIPDAKKTLDLVKADIKDSTKEEKKEPAK